MKLVAKIYPYIFALFCASIPFTDLARALPNILLCVLIVLAPFVFYAKDFQTIKKPFFFTIALSFFILLITIVFNRWDDLKIIERFFYIPLILILATLSKNVNQNIFAFVLGAFVLLILSVFNLTNEYMQQGELILNTGGQVDELLLGARPYVSFIYLISAYACFYLTTKVRQKKYKIWLIITGIIFIGFIFLIASRISMLSLFFSLIISTIYFIKKPKYYLYLFIGAIGLGVFTYAFSDNISKRFFVETDSNVRLAFEPRYHIWECASTLLLTDTKTTLFGRGFYGTEQALVDCYSHRKKFLSEDQKQWFVRSRFNTHNQYLDLVLSLGIFSFFFFVILLGWLAIKSLRNYCTLNFVLFVAFFLFTENMLIRQLGLMLIGMLVYFVLSLNATNKKSIKSV